MFANSRPVVLVKAKINRMDGVPDKRNFFFFVSYNLDKFAHSLVESCFSSEIATS